MKDKIKQLLRESSEGKPAGSENAGANAQYKRVYSLLQNNIFNHAEIVEKLWGDKDATNRSKFRKKLNKEANEAGKTHQFDDEEIHKIARILLDTSAEIKKNLGGKQEEE